MAKLEAKVGFERIFAETAEKLLALEEQKKIAIEKATAEVDAEFEDQKSTLEQVLALVGIEVEDKSDGTESTVEALQALPVEQDEEPASTFQSGSDN